jgi:carboxypeptidase C (cathepsin A)
MSYSRNSADYLGLNDERTTDDLVRFIGHLMSEFPELQQRDLYLAGE